jgi:hypothetical protein
VIRAQGAEIGPERPGTGSNEAPNTLSDEQRLRKANQFIGQMRQHMKEMGKLLEEARAEKDVVKLNCVNEKLTQAKGLLRVSEQSDIALQEAAAKRESEASEREYGKIAHAKAKIEQLRAEANECAGQLAYVVDQNTTVEVESPKDLPEQDVTNRPPPSPPVSRPPPASQFE